MYGWNNGYSGACARTWWEWEINEKLSHRWWCARTYIDERVAHVPMARMTSSSSDPRHAPPSSRLVSSAYARMHGRPSIAFARSHWCPNVTYVYPYPTKPMMVPTTRASFGPSVVWRRLAFEAHERSPAAQNDTCINYVLDFIVAYYQHRQGRQPHRRSSLFWKVNRSQILKNSCRYH
jgi:hypothetical protein